MIYEQEPKLFNSVVDVVGCFVEYDGRFVLLQRNAEKSDPLAWGIPSGKVESTDTDLVHAMQRELHEETGIQTEIDKLVFFKTVYVCYETHDIVYHMYTLQLDGKPVVTVGPEEHIDYIWVTPKESYTLPLMIDLAPCITLKYPSAVV